MEIRVHSTLAKKEGRKKGNRNPDTIRVTRTKYTYKIEPKVPSLENWGGGLKSLLWLANSPHTLKCTCTITE